MVEMISGKNTKAEKESIKNKLYDGQISVLIGTHALLFNDYKFRSLAIVIICLLYTSPSPRDQRGSRIASSA